MMGSFETMAGIEWQGGYESRDKIDIYGKTKIVIAKAKSKKLSLKRRK